MATDDIFDPSNIERALRWDRALAVPAGKERFQVIRDILKETYRTELGAAGKVKDFLSENLILKVGKSGDVNDLPRVLRTVLGSKPVQQQFVQELQTARYFMEGKLPGAVSRKAWAGVLDMLRAGGMPEEHLKAFGKAGFEKIMKSGGLGQAMAGLKKAQSTPAVMGFFQGIAKKVGLKTTAAAVLPESIAGIASAFKPSEAMMSTLAKSGVKGAGFLARTGKSLLGLGGIAPAITAYEVTSALKTNREQNQQADEMMLTGVVPKELGGDETTSTAFMKTMIDRATAMKAARFNAVNQEADLTREVLGHLSGQSKTAPRVGKAITLGSARVQPGAKMNPDEVQSRFDEFLGEILNSGAAPSPQE